MFSWSNIFCSLYTCKFLIFGLLHINRTDIMDKHYTINKWHHCWGSNGRVSYVRSNLRRNFRVDSQTDLVGRDWFTDREAISSRSTIMKLYGDLCQRFVVCSRRYNCTTGIESFANAVLSLSELRTVICNSADERSIIHALWIIARTDNARQATRRWRAARDWKNDGMKCAQCPLVRNSLSE